MTITLPVPGALHAALQTGHPAGLPEWLTSASPRCGSTVEPLHLDQHQAQQLADLTATVLWECQQDPGDNPLAQSFASACQEVLEILAAAHS